MLRREAISQLSSLSLQPPRSSGQEDSMRAAKAKSVHSPAREHPDWAELLVQAVNTPGVISSAYHRFWNYSVGNQILALFQCLQRRIEPGPIHTFMGWKNLDRQVKKGEKALTLCMPVTVNCRRGDPPLTDTGDDGTDPPDTVTVGGGAE